jgi:hypothetical protein
MEKENIKDLIEIIKHPSANKESLLETAYKRGYIDGIKFAKKKAIEAIE